ncbi:Por secretion system C-terminal sorting domain-containing protein [Saccharicrinis carchari]|uniref:Por secretion system C-terminal sorting domain-containing protein n=1 Tax=Saccharicrinis carchari TaxID=1168039 RepID=A0A521F1I7_SACCC|nr:T9SS type A sorting domain-containing protein [Saccharicrinis carchari]SMO89501.1 Por secretion system C-terminal sorting domain-containing protein [Saccharicrinis carchari]
MKYLNLLFLILLVTASTSVYSQTETTDFEIIATPSFGDEEQLLFLKFNKNEDSYNAEDIRWYYKFQIDFINGDKWVELPEYRGKSVIESKRKLNPWPEQGSDFKDTRVHIGNKMSAPFIPKYEPGMGIKNNLATASSENICYGENVDIELSAESSDNIIGLFWSGDYMWFYSDNGEKSFTAYSYSNSNPKTTHNLTKETVFYCFAKFDHFISGNNPHWNYIGRKTISVYKPFDGGAISSDQTICYDAVPTALTGTTPMGGDESYTYQWQSSIDNSTWSNISGATNLNYQASNLKNATHYRRTVNNTCGSDNSNTVTITVRDGLNPGSFSSDQTICYDTAPIKLTGTTPTGGNRDYTYQWQKSINNSNWVNIGGATAASYQPQSIVNTTYYRRTVNNICSSENSSSITITVMDDLNPGSISDNQTICYGTVPTILNGTAPAGGNGTYTYQWQKSLDNTSFTNISGATTSAYQPLELNQTTYFKRIINNTCGSAESNIVKVTVHNQLAPGTISPNQSICYGSTPTKLNGTAPSGADGTYSHQWQRSLDGISFTNISGATTLTYQAEELTQTTYFKRITNNTCGSVESNMVKVTVYKQLAPGVIGTDQTICYGSAPIRLKGTVPTGGDGTYTYQWQKSLNGNSFNNISGATSSVYQPAQLTQTTYFKRIADDGCNSAVSNTVTIIVRADISENAINSSQTICYNSAPQIIIGNNMSGSDNVFRYQWLKSQDAVNFIDISGANKFSYQPGNLTQTTYFKRIANNQCANTESNKIMVVVRPKFSSGSIGVNQTIIYGSKPHVLSSDTPTTGGSGNYSYQWRSSTDGTNYIDIPGAKSVSYQPDNLTQTTYYYRLTRDSECGEANTNVVIITVNTEHQLIGTIGDSQIICFNTSPNGLSSSGMNEDEVIYQQWQRSIDGSNWNDIPGATGPRYNPSVLNTTTYYKKRVTTASNGELETNIVTITVKDKFNPGSIGNDQAICSDNKPKPIVTLTPPNQEVFNKWESSDNSTSWNVIANETKDYLELPIIEESTYFRKVVSSECGELETPPVLITVNPPLVGGNIEEAQVIDYNGIPLLLKGSIPIGGNGIYGFMWEKSIDDENWTQIPDASEINYQPGKLTQTTYFRRIASSGDCDLAYSNSIKIFVHSELIQSKINGNQTICHNSKPNVLRGTEAAGGIGIFNYYWEKSTDGEDWEELYGNNQLIYQPKKLTSKTYFRLRTQSGSDIKYSNVVTITTLEPVLTPTAMNLNTQYCIDDVVKLILNTERDYIWYNAEMQQIERNKQLLFEAKDPITIYYQTIDNIGCPGDLKQAAINVDYVDTDITTNAIDPGSVENGERLTIDPGVTSNFASGELTYTWTFDHQEKGWYETMFDASPSQYFHWKGWYDITLATETPSGCTYTSHVPSAFYVNEEAKDERIKSIYRGTKASNLLDPGFGLDKDLSIKVYPSIFNAALNVEIKNTEAKLKFVLFDMSGKKLIDRPIEKGTRSISTAKLAEGIYLVRIINQDGAALYTNKVIRH